jgi:hypothetical protein
MRRCLIALLLLVVVLFLAAANALAAEADAGIPLASPGLAPSHMDPAGRLVEDWGTLGVQLSGEGVIDGPVQVAAAKLDDVVPAATATSDRGVVKLACTAYRAPIHPTGLDVLTVRVEAAQGKAVAATLTLELPKKAQVALQSVKLGNRTVVLMPSEVLRDEQPRDWGYCDEAAAHPGWAKPKTKCDPAFRNIRAGMGGVPIMYRFRVPPKSECDVVLGFCESHWTSPGERVLACTVEGAAPQQIDPIAKWGQHGPGAIAFAARDENGDGMVEVSVRGAANSKDRNPILNAIWLFEKGTTPNLDQVVAGSASAGALRYVDVGGEGDQSLYPPGKAEFRVNLKPGEAKELVFLVACRGGSAPLPGESAWNAVKLLRAAREVWRDWPQR